MAQFRGIVQGSRKPITRLGSKNSGLTVRCNGWDAGVTVYASHRDGVDVFEIYQTGGSNARTSQIRLGSIIDGEFKPEAV